MTTKKNASELAAERLGYGAHDPHADMLGDVEALLSRKDWSDTDRVAARAALDRAKTLPERAPEPDKPERRPATASEIAGAHMLGGKTAARELRRDGVDKI